MIRYLAAGAMKPTWRTSWNVSGTAKKPNSDVEKAHQAMSLMHIANASLGVGGHKHLFDANSETLVIDNEANKFLKRSGRAP